MLCGLLNSSSGTRLNVSLIKITEPAVSEKSEAQANLPVLHSAFRVPFLRVDLGPDALSAIAGSLRSGQLAGNGPETANVHTILRSMFPSSRPLLTHSCTGALEMSALLLDLGAGDEVIMPSWTFPSTANAVVLRGATPVFIDVDQATLNINVDRIEAAITCRTRAVICVHYAGVACDMTALVELCGHYKIALVEDAAQAIEADWLGKPLGSFGDFGAISFHGTKNVGCGEGGVLLVNREEAHARAEIVWEKGTDRASFERGEVSRYEWKTVGSSYLPSEITAALLASQLRRRVVTTAHRVRCWQQYHRAFQAAGLQEELILPTVPSGAGFNGHNYFIRTKSRSVRDMLRHGLHAAGIEALTHYVPLHSAPAGLRYGSSLGDFTNTDEASATLLRLPIYASINIDEQHEVVGTITRILRG